MQQGRIWHFGKIEFSVDFKNKGKNTQLKISVQVWSRGNSIFMKETRHLKTTENKRNLNTKWHLLQNDQNADTTLLRSHKELLCRTKMVRCDEMMLPCIHDVLYLQNQ